MLYINFHFQKYHITYTDQFGEYFKWKIILKNFNSEAVLLIIHIFRQYIKYLKKKEKVKSNNNNKKKIQATFSEFLIINLINIYFRKEKKNERHA